MGSKKFNNYLLACILGLSLLTIACDKRTAPTDLPSSTPLASPTPTAVAASSTLGMVASLTTIGVGSSSQFTASGGVAPYTYSVVSGGGSINASTGLYTAPSTAGNVNVRVTDSSSTTFDITVTIVTEVSVLTTNGTTSSTTLMLSPANSSVAIGETVQFTATGGVKPYTYSIVSGNGSMDGSTGVLTAPNTTGSVLVQVMDSVGTTTNYTITVTSTSIIDSLSNTTPVVTSNSVTPITTNSGSITLQSGITFNIPTKPIIARCGSVIKQTIGQNICSVNNLTGASQTLGLVLRMATISGASKCPSICMCTGETTELSGWKCVDMPATQTFTQQVRGCGSRLKIFEAGTANQTTCAVNYRGPIQALNARLGMTLVAGQKSICEQAVCTCTNNESYNYSNAGWNCAVPTTAQ